MSDELAGTVGWKLVGAAPHVARLPIAYLRKDEIFPDFSITDSEWGDAGRYYRH